MFAIPGTSSDPVTSKLLALISRHANPGTHPSPPASKSHTPTPKATSKQPTASRKKTAASKEDDVQSLNVPALLSPISSKPTKDKVLVRPKSVTKSHSQGLDEVAAAETERTLKLILEGCDEKETGATPAKTSNPGKKSVFNPPSKDLVGAASPNHLFQGDIARVMLY
ncbi:hypothetical protein DAPPUDRAFT_246110 [Daphnia pulex]|uniref:Uncharacterized protein n=1 Tax=Daphnia pulex TaxID=6669 RepID=E9GPN2_DAPPU|nr:hypothetical protein DAPPUDRAFT_246110 [Daphnia pulex]|eukprot:EFX78556.1 hypothetical protein DAPPUDRAFT_246110 [Daphnia pulex]